MPKIYCRCKTVLLWLHTATYSTKGKRKARPVLQAATVGVLSCRTFVGVVAGLVSVGLNAAEAAMAP